MKDLERFTKAQEFIYKSALAEIKNGEKVGHWMWFIFPQLKGLSKSEKGIYYGIDGLGEAEEYLSDEILGGRLVDCSKAIMDLNEKSAFCILGFTDELKLKSSMTLFSLVSETECVFSDVINKYFSGKYDTTTKNILNR